MATFLKGTLPMRLADKRLTGPLMTLRDYAALGSAPRKVDRPGTHVRVRSFDVVSDNLAKATGYELQPWAKSRSPDHMYTEYDDGREQYVFRAGPSGLKLKAQVDPARRSPDYGRGDRVLYETFLPGVSAKEAKRPAERTAAEINRSGTPYGGFWSNSNLAVGDQTQAQFGHRVGDSQTSGWRDGPRLAPSALFKRLTTPDAQSPRKSR